jgi:glycosyltransferase involved in cell wall biosynthesis
MDGALDSHEITADVTVGIPTYNRSRLLARAIASVLEQSYPHFTLVVSDNASDDDTASVVASFRDPRLVYRPLERNIGRAANANRLIELADTEFFVLLCDDDELLPDHLALTVDTLKRCPTVGVAHTGCVFADLRGDTLVPHARVLNTKRAVVFESGAQFLERSMKSGWTACFSSANFRRGALVNAGGLRPEDGVIDDFALLMRIANDWDFAYLNRPLAVARAHEEAASSALGSFRPGGFRSARSLADMLYEHRRKALAEVDLPESEARRLARIAEKRYRRDVLAHLSMRAVTGDGSVEVFEALGREIRRDRRLALDPMTWRFVIGQLGARRVRNSLRRALEPTPDHV